MHFDNGMWWYLLLCLCHNPLLLHRSMRWGLVPSTHKKSLKDFTLSTHNCCSETIMERPLYSRAFQRGQRCAIPADGFFEWNSTKGAEKIPHFVHRKRDEKSELSGNVSSKRTTMYVIIYIHWLFSPFLP